MVDGGQIFCGVYGDSLFPLFLKRADPIWLVVLNKTCLCSGFKSVFMFVLLLQHIVVEQRRRKGGQHQVSVDGWKVACLLHI